jgi:hypothetical protein
MSTFGYSSSISFAILTAAESSLAWRAATVLPASLYASTVHRSLFIWIRFWVGRRILSPTPFFFLRSQDLRQPATSSQAAFGGGHKLGLFHFAQVLKIRFGGPLPYCL